MKSTAERLKHFREVNGLDYEDIAYVLSIAENEYREMEEPGAEVPLKVLLKLSRIYKIPPETLLPPQTTKTPDQRAVWQTPYSTLGSDTRKSNPSEEQDADEHRNKLFGEFDLEKPRKPMTPKRAMEILKKHGTIVTEDEAEKVLAFMRKMAELAVDHATEEAAWKGRLRKEPQGFRFEKKGYSCRICHHGAEGGWYDHAGLRCAICQQAILKNIIPVNICGHDELYYNEWELDREFNLRGKILTHWIRQEIIKARTIPLENGKGKHYRIFLLSDNSNFLPPKEMLRCNEHDIEEKDGKEWQIPLRWFQVKEDPVGFLADYGIVRYLTFTKTTDNDETDTPSDEKQS